MMYKSHRKMLIILRNQLQCKLFFPVNVKIMHSNALCNETVILHVGLKPRLSTLTRQKSIKPAAIHCSYSMT